MKKELIYSLNIEDIQTVALNEIDRELTVNEIDIIRGKIDERINWYDTISYAINELSFETDYKNGK